MPTDPHATAHATATHPTGLLILHGNRAEHLAQTVIEWLVRNPLGALEEDILLVQSNGMAEWLKMTFASQASVCAATKVELPARFQWRLYRQTLGRASVPTHSPFDKTPLTWRLMQRLPQLLALPEFAPVAGFLQGEEPERPLQLARRLADLFDQYQIYRADWLAAWAAGRDVLPRPDGREPAPPVPPDQLWQPALWRALLLGDVGLAADQGGATGEFGEFGEFAAVLPTSGFAGLSERERAALRPELHARVVAALRSDAPTAAPPPRRVVLFGMTHLPLATLELLAALATRAQVLLALPNPCRFHWADIMDGRELLRQQAYQQRMQREQGRRHPLRQGRDLASVNLEDMHAHAHPLLAAWGRQSRDFIRQLDAFDDTERARSQTQLNRVDLFDDAEDGPAPSLLAQVQARIRDLVPLAEHAELAQQAGPLAAADQSVVFHIAHSSMREVEVLHDQLLQLLAQAPAPGQRALAPRDVVVMVPDIAAFEPAIRAVFGQYGRSDARHIPFDIADLSARQSSPLMAALAWLLRLPQQRCTFSELCDLLEVPALARHFGLEADALPQLMHWMAGAGLRWGLDADQRGLLGLRACGDANSALWALRRMLLGFASGAGPAFDGIEPHPEVGGLEAELAGSLALLLERLAHWWALLGQWASPEEWAKRARALLLDFFTPTDDDERAALAALEEALNLWLNACEQAEFAAAVPLAVAREAWLDALDEPSLNRRFRAGGVTFCTLMPMRAIPFEVLCLLGMNDGDYPRRAPRSDFDLMGLPGQSRPGDRSRRDDDRQLMLEAVLSARRRLHVSWTGRNVRDNADQPPSVLVAQLRDYIAAGWGEAALRERSTEHPLQPFSRRYFEQGTPSALFTYAREWRQAHVQPGQGDEPGRPRASASPSVGVRVGVAPPFVPDPAVPLSLQRLCNFVRQPVRSFFKERLNVHLEPDGNEVQDDEAFSISGLEEYGLLQSLLDDAQAALGHTLHQTPAGALGSAGAVAGRPAQPPVQHLQALVAELLARVRRAGRLPLGALGELAQAELAGTLFNMLAAWQTQLAAYPQLAPHRAVEFRQGDVCLQDWLSGLRLPEGLPTVLPVALSLHASRLCGKPSGRGSSKSLPPLQHKLLKPWLLALVAAATEQPVRLVLVGRDATLSCEPPDTASARATLAELLEAWLAGQHAPLPVALKTALGWLDGLGDTPEDAPGPAHPAWAQAASRYNGSYNQDGEVAQDACLARLFPDFLSLVEDGSFAHWAWQLYAPLRDWVKHKVSAEPHPEAGTLAADESAPQAAAPSANVSASPAAASPAASPATSPAANPEARA